MFIPFPTVQLAHLSPWHNYIQEKNKENTTLNANTINLLSFSSKLPMVMVGNYYWFHNWCEVHHQPLVWLINEKWWKWRPSLSTKWHWHFCCGLSIYPFTILLSCWLWIMAALQQINMQLPNHECVVVFSKMSLLCFWRNKSTWH